MRAPAPRDPLVFLVAGELSGDFLGGRLIAALKAATDGRVRVAGVGGPAMVAEGLESLFPMDELSVMGLAELLPHLPRIFRRLDETTAAVLAQRPDVVVTIDSPGFTFRLGRRLKGQGIPLVHYVAPTVWAWRPGRARRIAKFLDHLLVLLPFEPPYFEEHGLACTFVGHPVVESAVSQGDGAAFRTRHEIDAGQPLLCILPGSRAGEVARLLPSFGGAVHLLHERFPGLAIVVPAVPAVRETVAAAIAEWPGRPLLIEGEAGKFDAFAASDVALAASGTVAVELALAHTPAVIAYRINPLTYALARRLVRARFVNLVNILLDEAAIPERLQDDCTAETLAADVGRLLGDPNARARQVDAYESAISALRASAGAPSALAAEVVLNLASAGRRRPVRSAAPAA